MREVAGKTQYFYTKEEQLTQFSNMRASLNNLRAMFQGIDAEVLESFAVGVDNNLCVIEKELFGTVYGKKWKYCEITSR